MRLRLVPKETKVDFFKRWKLWLGLSGTFMVIALVSFLTQGLNYGIDFRGGTTIRTESAQPVDVGAYRDAIEDFQTALERDPDFPGAAQNLELARKILDYVEDARVQSDTGEDQGIGADEVVFDNKDAKGADTQIEAEQEGSGLLTADQWMNTVDTNTGDFLRQRFAIEAAQK